MYIIQSRELKLQKVAMETNNLTSHTSNRMDGNENIYQEEEEEEEPLVMDDALQTSAEVQELFSEVIE